MGRVLGQAATVAFAAVVVVGCGGGGTRRAPTEFSADPVALAFGPTGVGQVRSLVLHLANDGRTPLDISSITADAPSVQAQGDGGLHLESGAQSDLSVQFEPTGEGDVAGTLVLTTDALSAGKGGVVSVPFTGTGVNAFLQVQTPALDFGSVDVGQTRTLPLQILNPTRVATSFQVTLSGSDADEYLVPAAGQTVQVDPGAASPVNVSFSPSRLGLGQATATVSICKGCVPVAIPLTGLGIASTLEIDPYSVNFGVVAPGTTAQRVITVRNVGNQPLPYSGVVALGTDSAFAFSASAVPDGQLAPGAQLDVTVSYTPASLGATDSDVVQIEIIAGSAGAGPKIPVTGRGGSSCVTASPRTLDFGVVAEGMSVTRRVDLVNRCGQAVQVEAPAIASGTGGFFTLSQNPASFSIASGATGSVLVTFTPQAGGSADTGALQLALQEGQALDSIAVPLSGTGKAFGPCQYALQPASVDFGTVAVGSEVALGFAIVNTGTTQCFVSNMQLAAGTNPAFNATGVPSAVVDPGGRAFMEVRFDPTAIGTVSGLAEAWISSPGSGHPTVPLSGTGGQGCLTLAPSTVDFGMKMVSCGTRKRAVTALNQCASAVTLDSVQIAQATSSEYALEPTTLPLTLQPGAQSQFVVDYTATDDGEDTAAFQAVVGGLVYSAGLVGAATTSATQTDQFQQTSPSKVDILLVMDNSGSMSGSQQSVTQNIGALLQQAQTLQLDYQIAVTTTGVIPAPGGWAQCPGGAQGGEAGRFYPVDDSSPRIITPTTPNAAQVLANNVLVGTCHWWEESFEAAYRALTPPLVNSAKAPGTPFPNDGNLGFYRPDAKLVILFVSDDDDESTPPVTYYEGLFRALKNNDPTMLSVNAIAGPLDISTCPKASGPAPRYYQMVQDLGGIFESICTPDWTASLQKIGAGSFGPQRAFKLSQTPSNGAQITVQVNGVAVTSGWIYDPASNSVLFDPSAIPPEGATVSITYPLSC